tara:strand:+ start:908 stop:1120 length:213 start_codon:yes stop_codon:yes gene_type:complete
MKKELNFFIDFLICADDEKQLDELEFILEIEANGIVDEYSVEGTIVSIRLTSLEDLNRFVKLLENQNFEL